MKYAFDISLLSTCNSKPRGAIIVKNGMIISFGYNNVPIGVQSCKLKYGHCYRRNLGYLSGEGLHLCKGIHAEASAIGSAAKAGISINNSTIYTTCLPCAECAKIIINSGIERVVYDEEYLQKDAKDIFLEANISIERIAIRLQE